MGDFLANAQAIVDAKPRSSMKSGPKGGGGGGGGADKLRLIRVPQELLSQVDRVHDVHRKEIQGLPIECHFTEMKGGAEQAVDPDEHLHHEFRVRRIKKFVQDWSAPSRGLFRFEDKEEEQSRKGSHTYQIRQNQKEKNLIQLILKILLFYGAVDSIPKSHYYRMIKQQAAFFEEVIDTLETIRPFWKKEATQKPLKQMSQPEIDRLLYS